jgi:hypothetical protein
MYHVFIQNKAEMPPLVNIFFDSLKDDNPRINIHVRDDEANCIHQRKQVEQVIFQVQFSVLDS